MECERCRRWVVDGDMEPYGGGMICGDCMFQIEAQEEARAEEEDDDYWEEQGVQQEIAEAHLTPPWERG